MKQKMWTVATDDTEIDIEANSIEAMDGIILFLDADGQTVGAAKDFVIIIPKIETPAEEDAFGIS